MGGGSDKKFDLAERELARKKLIRYAKEHGIGAGRLATGSRPHTRKKQKSRSRPCSGSSATSCERTSPL